MWQDSFGIWQKRNIPNQSHCLISVAMETTLSCQTGIWETRWRGDYFVMACSPLTPQPPATTWTARPSISSGNVGKWLSNRVLLWLEELLYVYFWSDVNCTARHVLWNEWAFSHVPIPAQYRYRHDIGRNFPHTTRHMQFVAVEGVMEAVNKLYLLYLLYVRRKNEISHGNCGYMQF